MIQQRGIGICLEVHAINVYEKVKNIWKMAL